MNDSIFTKIINGNIPSYKIYENDKTLAFLDIDPLLPGHVLVIPKLQFDHIEDLPDEYYQAVFTTVKKVSKRLQDILGAKRAVIMVMGYDVPHAHVHVLPSDTGFTFYQATADRLYRTTGPIEPNHAELAALAAKLAFRDERQI